MINWLHRHFIPHEGNDHKPHFLRSETVQTLITLLLVSQVFFFIFTYIIAPNSKQIASIIASSLVQQTNSERLRIKISDLKTNVKLEQSAKLKANDMASKGYFAHNTPDGKNPWYFFNMAGYDYEYAGENLAVNFVESKDVTNAWMNSKSHRDNILNDKYTEIGIATAEGKYKGKDAIFVVQHFGKPKTNSNLIDNLVKETSGTLAKANNQNVLGATDSNVKVSFIHRILSMTGSLNITIEFAIGILSLIALLIALLIKIKIQHPVIIANGIILVSITICLIIINTILTQGTI